MRDQEIQEPPEKIENEGRRADLERKRALKRGHADHVVRVAEQARECGLGLLCRDFSERHRGEKSNARLSIRT